MLKTILNESEFQSVENSDQYTMLKDETGNNVYVLNAQEVALPTDIENLRTALNAERTITKDLKKQLKVEPKVEPKVDPTEQNYIAELKSQFQSVQEQLDNIKVEKEQLEQERFKSNIKDKVLKIATDKIRSEAIDDLLLYVSNENFKEIDGKLVSSTGKEIDAWTNELISKKSFWQKDSKGLDIKGENKNIQTKKSELETLLKKGNLTTQERITASKLAREIKQEGK